MPSSLFKHVQQYYVLQYDVIGMTWKAAAISHSPLTSRGFTSSSMPSTYKRDTVYNYIPVKPVTILHIIQPKGDWCMCTWMVAKQETFIASTDKCNIA